MSTHFDIACRDCRVEMWDRNVSRSEEALLYVIKHVHVFGSDILLAAQWPIQVNFEMDGYGSLDVAWLNRHKEHRLAVICEYEGFEMLEARLATGLGWWERSTDRP